MARVYGIDFFSVLTRGSQYRVESILVRLAHTQSYVMISPTTSQVRSARYAALHRAQAREREREKKMCQAYCPKDLPCE